MSGIGHNRHGNSRDLRKIFEAARPVMDRWLDVSDEMTGLRIAATDMGFEWGQIKALLKAQAQDERDETGEGKRVEKLLAKAENATAYADMLGLGQKTNFISEPVPDFDPETGEVHDEDSPSDDGYEGGPGVHPEAGAGRQDGEGTPPSPSGEGWGIPVAVPQVPAEGTRNPAEGGSPSPDSEEIDLAVPDFLRKQRVAAE